MKRVHTRTDPSAMAKKSHKFSTKCLRCKANFQFTDGDKERNWNKLSFHRHLSDHFAAFKFQIKPDLWHCVRNSDRASCVARSTFARTRPLCLTVRHPSWGRSMWGYRSRSPVCRWCGRSPLDPCFRRHAQCETVCQQVTAAGPNARESARRGLRSSMRCFLYLITCLSAVLSCNF